MGRTRDVSKILTSNTSILTLASASATYLTQSSASTTYATVANFPATAWTSFTPTVRQSTTVLTSTGSIKYIQFGKVYFIKGSLGISSTGSAGGRISVTSPIDQSLVAYKYALGTFMYLDAGTGFYTGQFTLDGSDGRFYGISQHNADYVGTQPSFTAASGDSVHFNGIIELA